MNLLALSSLVLGLGTAGDPPSDAPRLLRLPAVHGDQVVFTFGNNLWLSKLAGGTARKLTSGVGEGYASFSPDGKWLAFTGSYDGLPDVYVIPAEGGEPKRLTFDPEGDRVIGWTPDGKIAYLTEHGSPMSRQARLMLADPAGGLPEPTPIVEAADASFSPDGAKVAYDRTPSASFNWRRYRGGAHGVISIYDLKSNVYSELPHGAENAWRPMWVKNSIYYISDLNQGTVNLYRYDLDSKKSVQLTNYSDSDVKNPETDGKTIVFERDGWLWSFDIASGDVRKLAPRVLSDNLLSRPQLKRLFGQVSGLSLSPSGNRVAIEARGRIFTAPAAHGEIRTLVDDPASRAHDPNWSPDGKTIAYVDDATGEYQVYLTPQMGLQAGQKARQVTSDPKLRLTGVDWMPDSKHLVLGEVDGSLSILDTETSQVTPIAKGAPAITAVDYSSDSQWIAYIRPGKNGFGKLYLYNVNDGKTTQITDGSYRDDNVAFDLSGKYLYLVSARAVNPTTGDFERGLSTSGAQRLYMILLTKDLKTPFAQESDEEPAGKDEQTQLPVAKPAAPPKGGGAKGAAGQDKGKKGGKGTGEAAGGDQGADKSDGDDETPSDGGKEVKIDLDGLADRMIPLPLGPTAYANIVGAQDGVIYEDSDGLSRFDLSSGEASSLIEGIRGGFTFNANRTKMAYMVAGQVGIVDLHPGIKPFEGRIDLSSMTAVIDPKKEWSQIFWEAWRWERDHFYDPNFTGVDWQAVGKKYAPYVKDATDRGDLNYVLGLMIGELGTSHAYVSGGDFGNATLPISVGELGVDYVADHGKLRFGKIYRGQSFDETRRGPLGEPGLNVKEGEYLLEIDGKTVTADTDPGSMLLDKAGRSVVLTINDKPTLEGARRVTVHPLASESDLRYASWVADNQKLVSKLSGGKIGYVHVPDTDTAGIVEFVKGFYSQTDKQALIIDERWNAGGDVPTFFTEKLDRTRIIAFRPRYGSDESLPEQSIPGPKVMLINPYAGSGGDLFPYLFRKEKLGTLIGTRTWGGLVGFDQPAPLIDGGFVTAPQFAAFDPDTGRWVAENHGVDPDIEVDLRPDMVAKGRDPQLEKAVEVLLDKLKRGEGKVPVKRPKDPDFRHQDKSSMATG